MAVVDSLKIDVVLNGKKAEAWMKRFQKSMVGINKIAKANNNIFKDFLRLGGIAGFTKMSVDAMNLGHSLEVLSKRSGVSASNLSGMRNALASAGGKAEDFDALIKNMSHDLAKFNVGGSKFFQQLNKFGVQAISGGKVRNTVDILYDLAEASKNRAAMFGRDSVIAMLEDMGVPYEFAEEMIKGESSFRQFVEERNKLTGKLTDEQIKANEELGKSFDALWTAIKTNFGKFTGQFSSLPKYIDAATESISEHPILGTIGLGALGVGGTGLGLKYGWALTKALFSTKATAAAAAAKGGATTTIAGVSKAGLLAKAGFWGLLAAGLIGTPMEIAGYDLAGNKIQKTKPDAWDDFVSWLTKPAEKKDLTLNIPGAERFSVNNKVPEKIFVEDDNGNLTELSSWDDLASYNSTSSSSSYDSHDFNLEQTNNITVETNGTNGEEIGEDIAERLGEIRINPYVAVTGG